MNKRTITVNLASGKITDSQPAPRPDREAFLSRYGYDPSQARDDHGRWTAMANKHEAEAGTLKGKGTAKRHEATALAARAAESISKGENASPHLDKLAAAVTALRIQGHHLRKKGMDDTEAVAAHKHYNDMFKGLVAANKNRKKGVDLPEIGHFEGKSEAAPAAPAPKETKVEKSGVEKAQDLPVDTSSNMNAKYTTASKEGISKAQQALAEAHAAAAAGWHNKAQDHLEEANKHLDNIDYVNQDHAGLYHATKKGINDLKAQMHIKPAPEQKPAEEAPPAIHPKVTVANRHLDSVHLPIEAKDWSSAKGMLENAEKALPDEAELHPSQKPAFEAAKQKISDSRQKLADGQAAQKAERKAAKAQQAQKPAAPAPEAPKPTDGGVPLRFQHAKARGEINAVINSGKGTAAHEALSKAHSHLAQAHLAVEEGKHGEAATHLAAAQKAVSGVKSAPKGLEKHHQFAQEGIKTVQGLLGQQSAKPAQQSPVKPAEGDSGTPADSTGFEQMHKDLGQELIQQQKEGKGNHLTQDLRSMHSYLRNAHASMQAGNRQAAVQYLDNARGYTKNLKVLPGDQKHIDAAKKSIEHLDQKFKQQNSSAAGIDTAPMMKPEGPGGKYTAAQKEPYRLMQKLNDEGSKSLKEKPGASALAARHVLAAATEHAKAVTITADTGKAQSVPASGRIADLREHLKNYNPSEMTPLEHEVVQKNVSYLNKHYPGANLKVPDGQAGKGASLAQVTHARQGLDTSGHEKTLSKIESSTNKEIEYDSPHAAEEYDDMDDDDFAEHSSDHYSSHEALRDALSPAKLAVQEAKSGNHMEALGHLDRMENKLGGLKQNVHPVHAAAEQGYDDLKHGLYRDIAEHASQHSTPQHHQIAAKVAKQRAEGVWENAKSFQALHQIHSALANGKAGDAAALLKQHKDTIEKSLSGNKTHGEHDVIASLYKHAQKGLKTQ